MQKTNVLEELFAAQAHLGHKTNRVHPRANRFIYKIENGVSIIDLTQTLDLLKISEDFIAKLAQDGKVVLFVATKRIASSIILELCSKNNIPYVSTKWPAGFLTNFETLMRNIKKMLELQTDKEQGKWQKLVKYEQSQLNKQLNKLQRLYGGLASIKTLPDALCIVDLKKEKNALLEATAINIPVVAIVDTNVDPSHVVYPIPANDDSATSVKYIITRLVDAYVKGKKKE